MVTGPPGAGKTTLATRLSRAIGLPAIHRDTFKESVRGEDGAPVDNATATHAFFESVFATLATGGSCIVDAAFQHPIWEARLAPIVGRTELRLVVCGAPEGVLRARRLARAVADPTWLALHPDPGVERVKETGAWPEEAAYHAPDLPVPTLWLSTVGSPEELAHRVAAWLGGD